VGISLYLGIELEKMRPLLIVVMLFCSLRAEASHLMGGEITWECLSGGQYRFTLRLYRDCNGIPGPGNAVLRVHNHPAVSTIAMTLVSQIDISPHCNGAGPTITCAGGGAGAVEEFIYQSQPVTLAGIPPSQGWIFTFDHCCRNGAITNLQNPNTHGFTLRAIMYPYNGQNEDPCFDSSPLFAEKPATIVCTGNPFVYNHNAYDNDLDSLAYSWAEPLNDFVGPFVANTNPAPIPFASGYSVNVPLPGTIQNPNNIPATINPYTGEIAFTSFTAGNFVSTVKVEAWKCGQKVAEIFREIQIVLIPCGQNTPPDVTPPFQDPNTNLFTLFADTVDAGDTVTFTFNATDVELLPTGGTQSVMLYASGSQFGANFTSTTAGCLNQPCATLTPPPMLTGVGGVNTVFNWVTSCNHFSYDNPCFADVNTYTFVFRVQDDFCPVPSYSLATVSITIRAKPLLLSPMLHCLAVDPSGNVTLTWEPPPDTSGSFNSYHIYSSTSPSGPFNAVDSIFSYTQTTYTDSGANANASPLYYYIQTRSGCAGAFYTPAIDTLSTMMLSASLPGNGTVQLSWNPLGVPNPATASNTYLIYREYPQGTWTLVDSTGLFYYNDTIKICNDTLRYRIDMYDSLGCFSVSSIDTVYTNNADFLTHAGTDTAVCNGMAIILGGQPTAPAGASYQWSPSPGLSSATIANPSAVAGATTGYIVTATINSCVNSDTVLVIVNSLPNASAGPDTAMCESVPVMLNASGGMAFQWSPALGLNNPNAPSVVANPSVTTTYTVAVTDSNGCAGIDSVLVVVHPAPAVYAGSDTMICDGTAVQLNATAGYAGYSWQPVIFLSDPSVADPVLAPTTSSFTGITYTVTVTDTNGCVQGDTITINILPSPQADAGSDFSICAGDSVALAAAGGAAYQWSPSAGLSNDAIPSPKASPSTSLTYTVTVTDTNGCAAADDVTVLVNPAPDASFDLSYALGCTGVEARFTNTSVNGASYIWLLGDGTITATPSPVHVYSYGGTYDVSLIVVNGGCYDTVSITNSVSSIASYAGLKIPNVFTPNGDGLNDVFLVQLDPELENCAWLKVYNRWGNVLREAEGSGLSWDGKVKDGSPVPPGTYFYIAGVGDYEVRGVVTVLYD
jgi:gliding motility-associated-like protein